MTTATAESGRSRWSGWSGFRWTTISQGKNKIPFYRKQVTNKCTRVIFGLVAIACYIMIQQIEIGYDEVENYPE